MKKARTDWSKQIYPKRWSMGIGPFHQPARFFCAGTIGLTFLLIGCFRLADSPFSESLAFEGRSMNHVFAQALTTQNLSSPHRLAVLADTHANYTYLQGVLSQLNNESLDFLIHLGDFTDIAANTEYDHFLQIMKSTRVPWFVVIGNHDAIGRGKALYKKALGPLNFTVETQEFHFVFFNNNTLEFYPNGIDWSWLDQELKRAQASGKEVVLSHHVNHDSKDYFTADEQARYDSIVTSVPPRLILNGHLHGFLTRRHNNGVTFVHQVARTERHQYSIITLDTAQTTIEECTQHFCTTNSY